MKIGNHHSIILRDFEVAIRALAFYLFASACGTFLYVQRIEFWPPDYFGLRTYPSKILAVTARPPNTSVPYNFGPNMKFLSRSSGKTDVAVQIISNLYHNFPWQRTLIVTHSNQALNQLFEKIMTLDVDERHLLRLGHGEEALDTDKDFSRYNIIQEFDFDFKNSDKTSIVTKQVSNNTAAQLLVQPGSSSGGTYILWHLCDE